MTTQIARIIDEMEPMIPAKEQDCSHFIKADYMRFLKNRGSPYFTPLKIDAIKHLLWHRMGHSKYSHEIIKFIF